MRQLAKRFSSLGQEALGGFVGALVAQGVLMGVPGARNTYREGPAAAAAAAAANTSQPVSPRAESAAAAYCATSLLHNSHT